LKLSSLFDRKAAQYQEDRMESDDILRQLEGIFGEQAIQEYRIALRNGGVQESDHLM
jgi:hypothetical protein